MTRIDVLDHGYVSLVETWGSDESIVRAARMSTQKGFRGWGGDRCGKCGKHANNLNPLLCVNDECHDYSAPGDEKLLKYLWDHNHATPFEFAGAVFEVQAPLFVLREWHRHRTQSYNEASARYAPLPALDYLPTVERLMADTHVANKQAGRQNGTADLTKVDACEWLMRLENHLLRAEQIYRDGLSVGVPKEIARLAMTVGRYSRMRASANLRNWLAFERLRLDELAQWEIRQYAEVVGRQLAESFPRTWQLFQSSR